MDIKKLYEKVIQSEEVHGIPLVYILTVLNAVLDAIGSGECFYPIGDYRELYND